MNKELLRSIKFVLFSVSAGLIQIIAFSLLNELLDADYWVSYLTALVLSVLWNFTLNRKFTFKSANNVPVAMMKIAAFYCVFTPVTTSPTAKIAPPQRKSETPEARMAVTSMFLPKVAMVHMQPSSMVIGRMNRTFPGSL